MSDFNLSIPVILQHEGGFVDDPTDPGGATNYGISLRYLKSIGELGDLNDDGNVDYADIHDMTRDQAIEIYKTQWWDRFGLEQIKNQAVATKLFDMCVNMGVKQAIQLCQRACNTFRGLPYLPLDDDGILGKLTVTVINLLDGNLLPLLKVQCVNFYQELIQKKPKFAKYRNGWLNRANS